MKWIGVRRGMAKTGSQMRVALREEEEEEEDGKSEPIVGQL